MKVVRVLLILVLTLFWAVISLLLLHSSSSFTYPLAFVTLAYFSLIYLVLPLGTPHSEIAFKRFFIVAGLWLFMFSLDVLLSNECPILPVNAFTKSAPLEAAIMIICDHLGKYPTSLFIFGVGCYFVYLGYTKKSKPSIKQDVNLSW
jgi:hypothetical protein